MKQPFLGNLINLQHVAALTVEQSQSKTDRFVYGNYIGTDKPMFS